LVGPFPFRTDAESVVRSLFAALAAGRHSDALALMHPEIEATALADGTRYHGIEAVSDYLDGLRRGKPRVEVALHRVARAGDDEMVAHGRIRIFSARGISDNPAAWRVELRDGLIARIDGVAAHDRG
jgi:ketosteroid isomerase-like protein